MLWAEDAHHLFAYAVIILLCRYTVLR